MQADRGAGFATLRCRATSFVFAEVGSATMTEVALSRRPDQSRMLY